MLCTSHHISFGWSNQEKGDGRGIGDRRGAYRVLVGKPERKSPLGRPRGTLGGQN